jgi:6-phosphogluconolactonase
MVYRFDLETGDLTLAQTVPDVVNPTFLALHPSGRFLYAVNEVLEYAGSSSGSVSAFAVDRGTGALALLNEQPTLGGDPCHLSIPRTGHHVLVANYAGGSVAMYRIAADGSLGGTSDFKQHNGSSIDPGRQTAPHAHSVTIDPTTRFAMVADLGLDRIVVYRLDLVQGRLVPNDPPFYQGKPGAGPRHFDFHPSGRYAYVINELDLTLSALAYDSVGGVLTHLQTESTLPAGIEPFGSTADVHVHPSGRFVYGSNRGHDSIVVFAIDASTGGVTYVENQSTGGQTPRNFAIDPTGTLLLAANQDTHTIVTFRIDGETGKLTPTGASIASPSPACIKFARLD